MRRAGKPLSEWKLDALTIGHGTSIDAARAQGLYISTDRSDTSTGLEAPPKFAEPGIFAIRPDFSVYFAAVPPMPFARPHFSEIRSAIEFVLKHDDPARDKAPTPTRPGEPRDARHAAAAESDRLPADPPPRG